MSLESLQEVVLVSALLLNRSESLIHPHTILEHMHERNAKEGKQESSINSFQCTWRGVVVCAYDIVTWLASALVVSRVKLSRHRGVQLVYLMMNTIRKK